MGVAGADPYAPPPSSTVRRWGVVLVVGLLFVVSLVLQGVAQMQALDEEAARTGTDVGTAESWWTFLGAVFTAWQAAFLVVIVGTLVVGWVLTHGNPDHAPEIERLQTEIERLEARVETLAEAPRGDGLPLGGAPPRTRLPWRRG
jgi:hypothetical protein